ncbi:hypothetical protein [uncultured Roseobacter sp.]|uniref:hypothetical protein n=1 Tax=uncultured Roseobacter sp. TaxID=114847 RepID=UPI00260A8232|nr:hypothetical protein [uncultured Roseobacter sp.]
MKATGSTADQHRKDVQRYQHLTGDVMPRIARDERRDWPIVNDHCFQRVVLDTICGGIWYDYLSRPAYKNLTARQARDAVVLCEAIVSGRADLGTLNEQSLRWRAEARRQQVQVPRLL